MDDFAKLRKKLYHDMRSSGGKLNKSYYKVLYDYVVGSDGMESDFPERFIDLLLLNEDSQIQAPEIEYFFHYFSFDPVYDRYLINFITTRNISIPEEPDSINLSSIISRENYLKAWMNLQLELKPPEALPWRFSTEGYGFEKRGGLLVIQFLFYGDPGMSGTGESGGLATLLGDLGEALSAEKDISGVITVTVDDSQTKQPKLYREPVLLKNKHLLLKISLPGFHQSGRDYTKFQRRIEKEIELFSTALSLNNPELNKIFHVRYLDCASLAVSLTAQKLGIPLCATLTPDPHRRIFHWSHESADSDVHERLSQFHRLLIGDRIVDLSQGVLGIGKKSIVNGLLPYYPLLAESSEKEITGIEEGINLYEEGLQNSDDAGAVIEAILPEEQNWKKRPLIMNIGRLNYTKGQLNLLFAFCDYSLWKTHNLLLIGGDFENPNATEKEIINKINYYLDKNPFLKKYVCFLSAKPNKAIRNFQFGLQKVARSGYPDVYLCSSLKEEFGLSILEAMSSGMMVFAPLSGGAWEYICHGVNGFLIDTSSSDAIGAEFESYLYRQPLSGQSLKALSLNARKTIFRNYSLQKIAVKFINFYKKTINRYIQNSAD